MGNNPENILKCCADDGVKYAELWFVDILGFLKSFTVPAKRLDVAFAEGLGFDGSSIEGFTRIDESDMVAVPDPDTYAILPWHPPERRVARMFADVLTPAGDPFEGDPRYILKRNLAAAKDQGYTLYVGPEAEFFYLKEGAAEVLDRGGYFDLIPRDEAIDLRLQTADALEAMGIEVEYMHHEVASSQHEIDLRYAEALTMADILMTYKLAVKEIAFKNGAYATFMPKPFADENGSGMHINMSLFGDGGNAFFNGGTDDDLSDVCRSFLAGVMRRAPEFCIVTNQWVNSYKRLVPGFEAPVYITWARRNRSDMVRVPTYKPGKEEATRLELRSPDPACNPYLAFAVILAAGLEGVADGLDAPAPVEENVYEMSFSQRRKRKIKHLPGSLVEAIQKAENSKFLRAALGVHVYKNLIENKWIEWDRYRVQVTDWELDEYLARL
ncbi:MAG: glutamine synthetase [Candidatus Coatesbacteria bacterium]|nr:MAG: glutamine synthetase [Candidatus Coatesbacteria bacterium]